MQCIYNVYILYLGVTASTETIHAITEIKSGAIFFRNNHA